ncbi:Os05g0239900 [Oryza sativa Japonica Group]|uniref:Os05g0239900 protein n=2 Tax=Oryza TaxID=4527 RepID=Q60ET3_ORYSJ|nr:unknown protein [Oryza sativa Japonica Group]KAF2929794.1 hypothetical protein DAI22_05g083900 [Oryza sativa Japonica Group]BAH93018.1 Os05g0239900 [Oryza sativa Japonica Group]|eukprot:NP_001174290.1 Os05g0239900 [Oryza sativa Japonica Group]
MKQLRCIQTMLAMLLMGSSNLKGRVTHIFWYIFYNGNVLRGKSTCTRPLDNSVSFACTMQIMKILL